MRSELADDIYKEYEQQADEKNYIRQYFDDVKKVYDEYDDFKEEVEFLPENRDIFLKSNLKLVIATAKRYMNMGVPFEDLIGAGNVGLCEAFDKFKTKRNTVRSALLKKLSGTSKEKWSKEDVYAMLEEQYTYGNMLQKLAKKIPKNGFESTSEYEAWIKKHIKSAVFASVAFMWIRAYILIEINKYAHTVKIPDDALEKMPARTHFIQIDDYNLSGDAPDFDIPSDDYDELTENVDKSYREEYYKEVLEKALQHLNVRERRIVTKRFGIGLPGEMKIVEIAEDENISPSRCAIMYREAIDKIVNALSDEDKQAIVETLRQN